MMDPIAREFESLLDSFDVHMQARRLSPKTRRIYLSAARDLARWLSAEEQITTWPEASRKAIQGWTINLLGRNSPGYASMQWRAVQQLFRWLFDEEEIEINPMLNLKPPKLPEKVVPIIEPDHLRALFDSCKGKEFVPRRDLAILRILASTGMRLSELSGLHVDHVNVVGRTALVTGKGDRQRIVRFDPETAMAIDRYQRIRRLNKWAESPALWLSEKNRGPLTTSGVAQIIERRGEAVGIDIHAHQFRHTFAHRYLEAGGNEGDLMEQAGWKSAQMLRRYGASAKAERARSAYDRVDVMGNL